MFSVCLLCIVYCMFDCVLTMWCLSACVVFACVFEYVFDCVFDYASGCVFACVLIVCRSRVYCAFFIVSLIGS